MIQPLPRLLHATILLLVVISLGTAYQPVGAAATIVVDTTADENGTNLDKCSLREAVVSANENIAYGGCTKGTTGVDYIHVPAATREYSLKLVDAGTTDENKARTGDLDILESVQILGESPESVVISGASARNRVFHVLTTGTVLFRNLAISGGDYVPKGGGVWVQKGVNTFRNVHIDGNHAQSAGGGMAIDTGARVLIEYSEVSNNTAESAGGVLNEGYLDIKNSLIWQNTASRSIGAISITSIRETEKTVIVNSTIAQNIADEDMVGGISVSTYATLELLNSTITRNVGIGLEVQEYGGGSIKNTIVARQERYAGVEPDCKIAVTTSFISSGYNMVSDSTCKFNAAGDQVVPVAGLGLDNVLAPNGGNTYTYALLDGSPAVDAGTNSGCPLIDQRGYGRPVMGDPLNGSLTCDIGAFELNGGFSQSFVPYIRK